MVFVKGQAKIPNSGRKKGTKNKPISVARDKLIELTSTTEFWEKFVSELFALDGKDFVTSARGIIEIIEPHLQAITANITSEDKDTTLLERLRSLSESAKD